MDNLTIEIAHEKLIKKEISCKELVIFFLERIKNLDKKIGAFLTVCEKKALEEAEKKDREIKILNKEEINHKYLLGIPVAIKDIYSTKGIRTTAGSKVLTDYFPVYDATVVERLKEAGAIIIGKTNLDAWAHGSSGENSDFFPTHNPYDLKRTPGGSSSGSAAALASGMCLAATGTDTGGSIRLPASFCNLVGLKPTYGRVSRYGIIAMASSFDAIGHFTKTVKDSARILKITAGKDQFDGTSSDKPVSDYLKTLGESINGLRIGLPKEYFSEGISKEVKNLMKKAITILEKLGAKIEEITLPHTKESLAVYYIIQPAEVSSNLGRFDGIRFGNDRSFFGQEAKRRIMIGTYCLSSGYHDEYYLRATKVRTLVINDFEEAFKKVAIILTPTSPTPPFLLGEKINDPLQMYLSDIFTTSANIAGIPSLVVPAGFTSGSLPCGVQFLANYFQEDLLFKVGYAFEKETNYYLVRPKQ